MAGDGSVPPSGGIILSRYGDLFAVRSFRSFLTAGALQFAAPSTVLVVLLFAVVFAYPASDRLTYGAIALAFLGISSALPTLGTAFFAGAVADRHDRGRLMRVVNLGSIVATAAIALDVYFAPARHILVPGPSGFYLPLWILLAYPAWALVTVTSTLFRPAFNTSLPRLVERKNLGHANGLIYAIAALAGAAGTVGVGALLTVAPLVDALAVPFALFFATQVALLCVDADLAVHRVAPPRSLGAETLAGFGFLYRRRALLEMTLAALVINFLSAVALVELALYVASWLNLSAGIWYGTVVAVATLGGAVGFLSIARVRFEARAGRVMILLTIVMGLALLALGLVRSVWLALPIVFLYGMMPGMVTTVFLSTVQATVPDEMMGRVFAADEVGSYALVPVGQATGGALTLFLGVQGVFLAAGGSIVFLGLVMVVAFGALRALGYSTGERGAERAVGEA
jgi:hypothetical protein